MEHDGYLGDVCRICYRLCQYVIQTDKIKIIACRHSSYKTERSNRLKTFEDDGGIYLDEAEIDIIKNEVHYYCNICKTYIDKPEHSSDPPGDIIECTEHDSSCGCKTLFTWIRDKPEQRQFFKSKHICKLHKHHKKGKDLMDDINKFGIEESKKREDELEKANKNG